MSGWVGWHVALAVKPGKLAALEALTGEMVAATRRETGALAYRRFVSADGATFHVYERYADSAAAVAHLEHFDHAFSGRFAALVERRSFTVYGEPSDELKRLLDRFGAVYMRPFGPFEYW